MLEKLKPVSAMHITVGVSMRVDVVAILKRGDPEEIKRALAEVHRQKAFSLADSEYFKEELENAAKLHAHHIALISKIMPDIEVDPESITGLDYRLAKAFREGVEKCGEVPPVEDKFFKLVVEELNRLIKALCG
jgi:hypothetical protein